MTDKINEEEEINLNNIITFIESIKEFTVENTNNKPCIYHGTNQFNISNGESIIPKNKIIVTYKKLNEIIKIYDEGKLKKDSELTYKAIGMLMEKITTYESKLNDETNE